MKTSKLIQKVEKFFDLSRKKQRKKRDKLLKIIGKLEHKKTKLSAEISQQSPADESDIRYHELCQELKVVDGLIGKAKSAAEPD